jgi:hypothetical protein
MKLIKNIVNIFKDDKYNYIRQISNKSNISY